MDVGLCDICHKRQRARTNKPKNSDIGGYISVCWHCYWLSRPVEYEDKKEYNRQYRKQLKQA